MFGHKKSKNKSPSDLEKKMFRFLFGIELDDEKEDENGNQKDDDEKDATECIESDAKDQKKDDRPYWEKELAPDGIPICLINYNEKFSGERPILFRDDEVRQVISCLIGKFKSNALLIGAAGVGKTKIAEEIARMIANGDPRIPPQLKGYTVYELPVSEIVSGSGMVGALERKTNYIIKFASENKVILFIDEIHMLISGRHSYNEIAQMLKPALARGQIRVIGATTLQESGELLKDPAFNRRFSRIIVDELSADQTKTVLRDVAPAMVEHYGGNAVIPEEVTDRIVDIADDFRSAGMHRPDSALTLLDRAMADAFIDHAASLNSDGMSEINLTPERIKQTSLRIMTGTDSGANVDIDSLREKLGEIKGQDDVINALADSIKRDSLNIFPRKKPLSFLFAGGSGTGKSEAARILARELTGGSPIILNMVEYSEPGSINRMIGSPNGYVGSDSNAELPFDILESNPRKVIVLDEFEKGCKTVMTLFMNILEDGYMQTVRGRIIDFSQSVIIATTSAGCGASNTTIGFHEDDSAGNVSLRDLSGYFDTELLNRFTRILHFHNVSERLFRDIIRDRYAREVRDIKERGRLCAPLPDELAEKDADILVTANYIPDLGARPVSRVVRAYIEDSVMSYDHFSQ